jgi:hypothetical protein
MLRTRERPDRVKILIDIHRRGASRCCGKTLTREIVAKGAASITRGGGAPSVCSSAKERRPTMPRLRSRFRVFARARRSLAIVAVVLVTVLGGGLYAASPALAAGSQEVCQLLGTYEGVSGDICVWVSVFEINGTYYAGAEATATCYDGSTAVECAGVDIALTTVNPTATKLSGGTFVDLCGHQWGPCGNPFVAAEYNPNLPLYSYPAGCAYNIWSVVYASYDGDSTSIQLPGAGDDHVVSLSSNLGTPHINIPVGCT